MPKKQPLTDKKSSLGIQKQPRKKKKRSLFPLTPIPKSTRSVKVPADRKESFPTIADFQAEMWRIGRVPNNVKRDENATKGRTFINELVRKLKKSEFSQYEKKEDESGEVSYILYRAQPTPAPRILIRLHYAPADQKTYYCSVRMTTQPGWGDRLLSWIHYPVNAFLNRKIARDTTESTEELSAFNFDNYKETVYAYLGEYLQ